MTNKLQHYHYTIHLYKGNYVKYINSKHLLQFRKIKEIFRNCKKTNLFDTSNHFHHHKEVMSW